MSLTFNMVSGNYGDIPTPTEKTVSGAVVHITDALRKPAIALSTAINPVQDLHGYDSPWPAGGGKNLITKGESGNIYNIGHLIPVTQNETIYLYGEWTYTSSSSMFVRVFDSESASAKTASGTNPASNSFNSGTEKSITIPVNGYLGVCYNAGVATYTITKMMVSRSSITQYEPYSNICPISGFGAANIVVSPTTTAGDGTTYTVSFGAAGTVYGGTLDVTAGTLTVTHGQIASYAGEALPGAWISDRDAYAVGTTPTTGAQVVYELASAQTYTLTPTEVALLLGTNNVWSDTGDTTLTYLADGRVNSLMALNMLLGNMYTPSADVSDREALDIIMGGI